VLTFWLTGAVFVAVGLFTAYCIWKYKYNKNRRAEYEPENAKLEWFLTIITSIGVIALLAPGLIVWNNFVTVPKGAFEIEVVGQQWSWMYRLPGKDGILGTTDIKNIDDDNIFGMNTDDPYGLDDILIDADDLHLLKDQAVKLNLRALDVLHDFYVPQFRAKMDMVPGMITYYWFTPIRTGEFEILCAEYCGTGHYAMLGYVIVDEQEDYDEWLSEQMTFEEILASNGKSDLIKLALNKRNDL
jgi:cytochrome c oxidase subunit 2